MKAALLQAREVAPAAQRTTRRVHVGEEFFAAAFASIVLEHVRPLTTPASKPVQSREPLPLAQPTPLASTSMLEAALSQLCDAPPSSAPAAAPAPVPAAAAPVTATTLAAADLVAISSTETRISIEHPELGAIRISLSLDGHALVLSATTESRAAQTAVSLCAPQLRVALSSQGLSLRTFDVSLTSDSDTDSPDPRMRTRKRRGLDTEA